MEQKINIDVDIDGVLLLLNDDEVEVLYRILAEAIYDGAYPPKMRIMMKIFDKIDTIHQRK